MLVPELEFSIEGHTDSIGTENYNDWLSEACARSVADFLTQEGVKSGRMETGASARASRWRPTTVPKAVRRTAE
jgi:outer membrane protein OmpA-like peptidoglycan-associated protein